MALLIALLGSVGMGFDKTIRVDTCKTLLASLSPEDMNSFINHCFGVLLQPLDGRELEDGELAEELSEEEKQFQLQDIASKRRLAALESLYHLFSNYDQLDMLVLARLLLVLRCVKAEAEKKEKVAADLMKDSVVAACRDFCYPAMSEAVQSKAGEMLAAICAKEEVARGVLSEFDAMLKEVKKDEKVSLRQTWEAEDEKAHVALTEKVKALHAANETAKTAKTAALEKFFVNVAVSQCMKPEYSQFVGDLVEWLDRVETKKEEERPLAVFLDVALILLRTGSKSMCEATIEVFGVLDEKMKEEDVKDLLSVFWNDEGVEMEEEEEEDGEEMEVSVSEEESEEEEKEEESKEEEEKEESDKEEKEEDTLDEDMELEVDKDHIVGVRSASHS